MKIYQLLLCGLLAVSTHAKGNKWQPLRGLDDYATNAFHLKQGVAYFEIRQYRVNKKNEVLEREVVKKLYRTPLKSFGGKIVKQFRRLTPNFAVQKPMYHLASERAGVGCEYRYNGFMIDNNGKMWRATTAEDIIGFLGDIDTPAEAQTILWLRSKDQGTHYRKTSRGYEVITEEVLDYPNMHNDSCRKITHKATINKKGKIVRYKPYRISKTKKNCSTMTGPLFQPCDDYYGTN